MLNRLKKNYSLLVVVLLVAILMPSCNTVNDTEAVDSESTADLEEESIEDQEPQEALLYEGDFMPAIGGLPYKGAALFINYGGAADLSDYDLTVDIINDGEVEQENMPVENIDGELATIIIDLMYLPGDELEFIINIQDSNEEDLEIYHSEKLERYPWKDWIFDLDETISLKVPGANYNFKYNWPGIVTGLEAHSSWDFMTRSSDDVEVYSGIEGIVFLVSEYRGEYNVYLYNPFVGAIIQNGHLAGDITLRNGQRIYPGDFLANIALSSSPHNHYSVIRPFGYTRVIEESSAPWLAGKVASEFNDYYWPIWHLEDGDIFDAKYYRDPFYFHEPATLGYWHEDTLPEGLIEEMLKIFERDNPEVELPAREPLNN